MKNQYFLPLAMGLSILNTVDALKTYTVNVAGDSNIALGGTQSSANTGDLRYVINSLNYDTLSASDTCVINFALMEETISLLGILPPINMFSANTLTIDGSNTEGNGTPIIINGGNTYRGLTSYQGNVALQNLTLNQCKAKGGDGAGGGAGLGGGLLVLGGETSISGVAFTSNSAVGGDGSASHLSGGGGLGGNGGVGNISSAGGGGFSGNGGSPITHSMPSRFPGPGGGGGLADGGSSDADMNFTQPGSGGGGGALLAAATGGNALIFAPEAGSNTPLFPLLGGGGGGQTFDSGSGGAGAGNGGNGGGSTAPQPGGAGGGGGGGTGVGSTPGGAGGVGGGGGGASGTSTLTSLGGAGGPFGGGGGGSNLGGSGGLGGGGGGSWNFNGGGGGFGGGGGGASANGGAGGFGGGGGSGGSMGGAGGVGGGSNGGGGAGLGGAVFVKDSASLIIQSGCSFSGSSVMGGIGNLAADGAAVGDGIFICEGSSLSFSPSSGTITVSEAIADTSVDSLPGGSYTPGSGAGASIIKSGAGTLVLSGTNTYKAGTTVSGGTLSIASESNIGGSAAPLNLSGGTLLTTGDVAISGSITISDDSTITASSGTVTSSGVLTGTGGKTLSNSGNLSLNTVSVSSGTFTIAGPLLGTQELTKSGAGVLNLSGPTSYSGITTISEGTLSLNNTSLSPEIRISAGATLKGTGSAKAIISEGASTIEPGNSIGTLYGTSVDFNSNSIFSVEVNPAGDSSRLSLTGTATLAGNVIVTQDGGSYPAISRYLILEASNVVGSFSPVVTIDNALPFFTYSLLQAGNNIYLVLNNYEIPTAMLSGNAAIVANYLNNNAPISALDLVFGLTGDALQNAINSISTSRNSFGNYVSQQNAFSLSSLVSGHLSRKRMAKTNSRRVEPMTAFLADASDTMPQSARLVEKKRPQKSVWISGFGEYAHQKAESQNPAFNYISEAVLLGLDYEGKNGSLIGGALGYAHTHIYQDSNQGHSGINYYYASIYGDIQIGKLYISPSVWGFYNQNRNVRHIVLPDFSKDAKAKINAWQFLPHLELGYTLKYGWGEVIPFTSADWAITWQKEYKERGAAPFNASAKSETNSMVRSETGLRFCESWDTSWGTFSLWEKASYVFQKPFKTGTVNTAFVGMPSSFTVTSFTKNLNLADIGLDFEFFIDKKNLKIDLNFDAEIGSSYWSNQLMLTFTKGF